MIADAQQREEFMLETLEKIAALWPADASAPEEETYDDTESAYNNGEDCATYRAVAMAREAIAIIKGE